MLTSSEGIIFRGIKLGREFLRNIAMHSQHHKQSSAAAHEEEGRQSKYAWLYFNYEGFYSGISSK